METANEQFEKQVERANVQLRRKVVLGLVAATGAGIALFAGLQQYILSLNALGQSNPDLAIQKISITLMVTAAALGFGLMLGGLYLLDIARKVYATKRYPPAGMSVLQDTVVLTGEQARMRGIVAGALSLLVILGGILIPAITYVLIRTL